MHEELEALKRIREAKARGDRPGVLAALEALGLPDALERFWTMKPEALEALIHAQEGHKSAPEGKPVGSTEMGLKASGKAPGEPLETGEALRHFLSWMPAARWEIVRKSSGKDEPSCLWGGTNGNTTEARWETRAAVIESWPKESPEKYHAGALRIAVLPSMGGFMALDLDRNHKSKGEMVDGVEVFLGLFEKKGIPLPRILKDLDTFPAYTKTASGGLHLWFKHDNSAELPGGVITPGVEIHGNRNLIFIPPSRKPAGGYVFHGDLDKAPKLETLGGLYRLLKYFKEKEDKTQAGGKKFSWERPCLEKIFTWSIDNRGDKAGGAAASWALREGYTKEEILAAAAGVYLDRNEGLLEALRPDKRPSLEYVFNYWFEKESGNWALFKASSWAENLGYTRGEIESEVRARGYDPQDSTIAHPIRKKK